MGPSHGQIQIQVQLTGCEAETRPVIQVETKNGEGSPWDSLFLTVLDEAVSGHLEICLASYQPRCTALP